MKELQLLGTFSLSPRPLSGIVPGPKFVPLTPEFGPLALPLLPKATSDIYRSKPESNLDFPA